MVIAKHQDSVPRAVGAPTCSKVISQSSLLTNQKGRNSMHFFLNYNRQQFKQS